MPDRWAGTPPPTWPPPATPRTPQRTCPSKPRSAARGPRPARPGTWPAAPPARPAPRTTTPHHRTPPPVPPASVPPAPRTTPPGCPRGDWPCGPHSDGRCRRRMTFRAINNRRRPRGPGMPVASEEAPEPQRRNPSRTTAPSTLRGGPPDGVWECTTPMITRHYWTEMDPAPGARFLGEVVVGDESEFGAVVLAVAVGEPELAQVREHLGDGVLAMPGGPGLADVLGEQVDQHDAAEVGRGGLELDRHPVEHPLGQAVLPPPPPGLAVAVGLVLGERPRRLIDPEGPLLPAQHQLVDRDPRPVRRRPHRLERIRDDSGQDIGDDLEEVQFGAGRRDLDDQILAAPHDGHRGAGQDGIRLGGVERVSNGGGPVHLARPQDGRGRTGPGVHVRVVFRLDSHDALGAAVGPLGGDEPGRIRVLLSQEPALQGVAGQMDFAEDEQEVAALDLAG